ncbi:MAG TPA: hypothetical protein VF662_01440 [Allosphingosinicella sp.]
MAVAPSVGFHTKAERRGVHALAKTSDTSWILRGLPRSAVFGEKHERSRRVRSSYIRTPYALEYNPWSSAAEIEDAIFYRGVIVSAFAQIETMLGELAIRASLLPQYVQLRRTFPFSAEKRIAFLRKVFSTEPLMQYRSIAVSYLDRFDELASLRHMAAHARMQVLGGQITFHDIPQSDGTAITMRRQPFVFAGLELLAWRSAKLARAGHKLSELLNQRGLLPPLNEAE